MANTALTPVEFHGATLSLVSVNGLPFVAVKPICEALGLQWEGQLQRIKRHAVLSTCMCVTHMQMPGDDQTREVVTLPLDKLNGWLFGISVGRVKPELRSRLTQYQAECFDVLARHFGVKQGVSTIPAPVTTALDVQTLCQLILGGIFTGRDFIELAYAVNERQFRTAVRNPHQGYGAEVAKNITSDLPWADLYAINVAASMEINLRTPIPAKAAVNAWHTVLGDIRTTVNQGDKA